MDSIWSTSASADNVVPTCANTVLPERMPGVDGVGLIDHRQSFDITREVRRKKGSCLNYAVVFNALGVTMIYKRE
jgi:hypothetical protein